MMDLPQKLPHTNFYPKNWDHHSLLGQKLALWCRPSQVVAWGRPADCRALCRIAGALCGDVCGSAGDVPFYMSTWLQQMWLV